MDQTTATGFGSTGWKLAATGLFVFLNGFFVAAEFALVKVRPSQIDALASSGSRRAGLVKLMLSRLDLYLSACQLGITISSLVLGWLAEPAVAVLLIRLAELAGWDVTHQAWLHPVALVLALTVVTVLHMVVGEQAPKVWAIQQPDKIVLGTAYPMKLFAFVFRPFIWVVNALSTGLLRIAGMGPASEHGADYDIQELRAILHTASETGRITSRQMLFGENILGMVNLEVRHIMVPRVDVAYLSTAHSREQNLETIKRCGHSRFALGDPDLDSVIGLVHARDVLHQLLDDLPADPKQLARPLPTVPDTQPMSRLIRDLQKSQTQCALVVDEHGTTVGLAFLEDALEEIVGPIYDEFDSQVSLIDRLEEGVIEMAGHVPLPDAQSALGIDLGDEADTIAGAIVSHMRRLPSEGDTVEITPYLVTVLSVSRRRIARVRFERLPQQDA